MLRFCELSTIHGLNLIARGHNKMHSIVWALIFLGAFGALVNNITTLMLQFLEAPRTINVQVYSTESLALPNITLCVLRRINKTKLIETFDDDDARLFAYFDSVFFSIYTQSWSDPQTEYRLFSSNNSYLNTFSQKSDKSVLFSQLINFTLTCEGMFDKVYIGVNEPYPLFCEKWIRFLTQNGPCFALREPMNQTIPGAVGGATITYVHPFAHVVNVPLTNSFLETSIHLFVDGAKAIAQENPIAISVGTYTHVAIDAHLQELRPGDEKHRCYDDAAIAELRASYDYTPQNCMYECMSKIFLKRCECVPFTTAQPPPNGSIANFCNPIEAYACTLKINNEMARELGDCQAQKCYQRCIEWSYTSTTSAAPIDQRKFPTSLLKLPDELDEAQKQYGGLTMIDVYYGSISYSKMIEVETMTPDLLIASMGGAFGWWSGASIISLMHLLEFVAYGVYRFLLVTGTTTAETSEYAVRIRPPATSESPSVETNSVKSGDFEMVIK